MNNLASQTNTLTGQESTAAAVPSGARRLRLLGLVLVALAVLLSIYVAVAYLAWQRGQSLQRQEADRALQAALSTQMALAEEDVRNGNFALALRRLDWVATRQPGYPGAAGLRAEAQAGLNARLTPAGSSQPPQTAATATPAAEETPVVSSGPDEPLAALKALMAAGQWEAAVAAIPAFQLEHPNFQRRETDQMLFDAYVNLGQVLLAGSHVELGLFYLSQAEKLGDLPQEVEDQRAWAQLYLLGIGYYGVDWPNSIFYLRGLCAAAPFYQDACGRLRQALEAYGDQLAAALDWCPAERAYAEALRLANRRALAYKLDEAAAACLQATPTPAALITSTVPITAPLLSQPVGP